jgi:hypothetical protein
MSDLFTELARLLENLDEQDWEQNGCNRDSGKKKFEARRRIQRVSSILDQIDEQPFDSDEELLVSTDRRANGNVAVVVDSEDAELDWKEGESTAIVTAGEKKTTVDLPFGARSVTKKEKIAMTIFIVEPEM